MKARDIAGLKSVASGRECFEKAFRKVEEYMSDDDFLVYYDKEELDKFEKAAFRRDGLEEGLAKGRKQVKSIINSMIDKGMSIYEISDLISISIEEINDLLN